MELEIMAATTKRADTKKRSQDKVEQTEMGAVSVLDLLEADHQEVDGFFDEYEDLEDAGEKERLALKICLALTVHTQIEEEIFYPAAREAIERAELIDEAIVEHASAKQLIAEIEEMDAGDELYDDKVKVLGEQVRHHVEEEEDKLFPEIESSELDLEALGKKMTERKAALLKETKTKK
jgi:Hemerythrin HHE cation binding domain